jgi:hypothetical protein
MSGRAIAEATDTPKSTVADDVHQVSRNRTPETRLASVTGLDGKRYPFGKEGGNAARQPRRKPITDAFRETTRDLLKKAERIERLAEDDRFHRHRDNFTFELYQLRQVRDGIDSVIAKLEVP